MKIKYLCALLLAALVYSCDDSTTGIGDSLIPDGDRIDANTDSYKFTTRSLLADSVYARTNTAYLGRYTDEQFGEFSADFLAQFTCTDNFEFDEEVEEITGVTLHLSYTTYFGDSLNAMRMQIDTLDKIIPEKELSTFYTSVNPAEYYNEKAKPIAVKAYSAVGPSTILVKDTVNNTGAFYYLQSIKLPLSLGTYMFNKYKENKGNYKDAETFIRNVFKGVYVRCTHGDGTILYIDDIQLGLTAKKVIENSAGIRDSVLYKPYFFAASKEVIQANHFQNSEKLKELVEENQWTYIKSPAGIYTEATFPAATIYEEHKRDTLNGVSVTFTRYNDKSDSKYKMDPPKNLLMVRKKEMFSFFEENKMYDNQTSFLCNYSGNNTYTFSNIAPLITYCINERNKGLETDPNWEAKNPDWNKVVLIPVKPEEVKSNQVTQIVGVSNSLGMESARLKGGTESKDELKMQIFYTTFN